MPSPHIRLLPLLANPRIIRPLPGLLQTPALWVFALLFIAKPIYAQYVDIIVSGTVSSGTDTSGVFGPANTDLTGQSFTVEFLFNGSLGTQSSNGGDGVKTTCESDIGGNGTQSPGIAYLTIGLSAPYLFDVNGNPQGSSSAQRTVTPDAPFDSAYFQSAQVNTPFGGVDTILQRTFNHPFTIPCGWGTPFSDSGADSTSGTFGIALNGQSASGALAPQSVVVTESSEGGGELLGDCSCKYSSLHGVFSPSAGDPIDIASGNVFYQTTDYTTAGQNPLSFTRYYNSLTNTAPLVPLPELSPVLSSTLATSLGTNWRSTYDRYLKLTSASTVIAERPDGQQLNFALIGSTWTPDTDIDITLTNSGNQWMLTDRDDTVETYIIAPLLPGVPAISLWAQLNSIRSRSGYTQTLSYNGGGQLALVTDSYNRTLTLSYGGRLLQTVTTPDATTITYAYARVAGGNRLTTATFSTTPSATVTYLYANNVLPFSMTGIRDENGNLYAAWTYDTSGRGLTSQFGVGENLATISYNDTNGARTVTNALGVADTYSYTTLQNIPKVTQISRAATATTAAATETFTYDTNGYLASVTDWNGNRTTSVNDIHGQPTTIIEAVGTAVARTATITYDGPTFVHLPQQIVTPGLTANFTYDAGGELLTRTLTDTTTTTVPYSTSGQVRTRTNTWSNFLFSSTKTPNGDITVFGYDATGALVKITNALNQATNVTAHTGGGLPQTIVDPNSVNTHLTYDARQRLLSSAVSTGAGTLTTSLAYDAAGNLSGVTLPDGSKLTNAYDAAHRLTGVTDLLSQSIAYTLDALGDRTQANVSDATPTVQGKHSASFDALGRMLQDIGVVGQTTAYSYDPNGNALTVTDPLLHKTQQAFDTLNRPIKITDPAGGITSMAYDPHDRPISVTDPNGNTTTYAYDGFGGLVEEVSPARGNTVYRYDPDGNLTQSIDANGAIANHTYDILDRVATTTYPADNAENVTYTYDQTGHGFGIGRLTSVTDAAGTLGRTYDERGNVLTESRVRGTATILTSYGYDAASRVASITYPLGYTAAYARDTMGRVTGVTAQGPVPAAARPVASNISYKPFGPPSALTYGNGVAETRSFDLDYRLTSLTGAGTNAVQSLTYGYDAANNVLSIADGVAAANSQAFGYDALNRLSSAAGVYGSFAYTYDSNGNRLTETPAGAAIATSAANLDGLGSVSALTYNQASRLAAVSGGAVTEQYAYDFYGHRLLKTEPTISTTTLYSYDRAGHLLEESNNQGNPAPTDYIYLDDGRPIATMTPVAGNLYFFHDDRLGTPQMATDANQANAWGTTYQPFGQTGNIQSSLVQPQNLRLPGQEFDADSGFYHNGFRDYLPSLGRYLEPDPIGLAGGPSNLYTYVDGNPISSVDPSGLDCVSANGTTMCHYFGGPAFSVPTPPNFPAFIGPDTWIDTLRYHSYDVKRPIGCADPQAVMQSIINNPTPGIPLPASPTGQRNNAPALIFRTNLVTSYLTRDLNTGAPLVVNITDDNSAFPPGYVVFTVSNGVAHAYGEGLSWWQTAANPFQSNAANFVWGAQLDNWISQAKSHCGCR